MAKSKSRIPKVYRDFLAQPAPLTKKESEEIDRAVLDATSPASVWRRLALASLTRSGMQLSESMDDAENARLLASVALQIDEYVERLKSLTEIMRSASIRIHLALCKRPDMDTILEMARTNLPDGSEVRAQ